MIGLICLSLADHMSTELYLLQSMPEIYSWNCIQVMFINSSTMHIYFALHMIMCEQQKG